MTNYLWNNKIKLQELHAIGENNRLIFQAGQQKAEVYIKGQGIDYVTYHDSSGETLININQAHRITVGSGNWQREVFHFLVPSGPAPTLRLGFTTHSGEGSWSSLPHDFELNTEPGFEEIFFYLLNGGSRRAIQVGRGVWLDNEPVDSVWPVKHETFSCIPMGYHPVVGEPGVVVVYIWAYLAKYPRWEKVDF